MRKTVITTAALSLAASIGCLVLGKPGWLAALWTGAAWGLANFWCMARAMQQIVEGASRWRPAGWLALKFLVLYGAAAWMLVGWRISAAGWLIGFTLSLAGLGMSAVPSFRSLAKVGSAAVAFLILFSGRLALASEAAHGEGGAPAHPPEIPNLITIVTQLGHGPFFQFLHAWENTIYAFVIVGIVGGLIALGARSLALLPSRAQIAVEAVVEGIDGMICGVLGKKEGRRYLPFLGTLFLFILAMNLSGLVPGLKSPTSRFEMTMALGFCVFVCVQWTGIRRMGILGYLDHMIGQPRDPVGWILCPLMLFIHGIGEIVKPVSLALRLFGNVMGEDTLLGVFVTLGALSMAWTHLPIGIPMHLPFVLLAIIFSAVQALVFTMLSTIYIYMMLPHEEHGPSAHHAQAQASGSAGH
ncbi:MAG: F0F1 ATP synthase subunit A [Candidatus Omnitrophica bacterium]|nr:F0F1 ATP synthase subunit A [Candidatus Omnitrophota bacterium]